MLISFEDVIWYNDNLRLCDLFMLESDINFIVTEQKMKGLKDTCGSQIDN